MAAPEPTRGGQASNPLVPTPCIVACVVVCYDACYAARHDRCTSGGYGGAVGRVGNGGKGGRARRQSTSNPQARWRTRTGGSWPALPSTSSAACTAPYSTRARRYRTRWVFAPMCSPQ